MNTTTCPRCHGSGIFVKYANQSTGMDCFACRGSGSVSVKRAARMAAKGDAVPQPVMGPCDKCGTYVSVINRLGDIRWFGEPGAWECYSCHNARFAPR